MKTIAVDFDGVIHSYGKGWHDGSCYDVPLPGAIEGLQQLLHEYTVFILSTRNPRQIQTWLQKHAPEIATQIIPESNQFWNNHDVLGITNRKLPAMVYIDDRGYLFRSWDTVMSDRSGFADYPHSFDMREG